MKSKITLFAVKTALPVLLGVAGSLVVMLLPEYHAAFCGGLAL